LAITVIFTFGSVLAAGSKYEAYNSPHGYFDRCSIELDDGSIIMSNNGHREPVIEITEDYELYINGRFIELDDQQRELVAEYYDKCMILVEEAVEIGAWGAKIGLKGAKVGLGAIASLVKILDEDYDWDDYEREIELQAEELEDEAEELEEQAEELEDLADELEEIFEEMEEEIEELGELDWY
jgi:hypothetical protein